MILLRWMLAAISILVGIVGLLLPILPGWLFFGIAALLLFPESALTRRIVARIKQRFPSTRNLFRILLGER
ncbi:MAG TPA: hypothetical protein VKL19_07595 [Thermoanaerobaculia bacterium]|nr:hypothetical protein [Thermoanaerobaculia bacterium]